MLVWGGAGGLPRPKGKSALGGRDFFVPPSLPPPQELGIIPIGPLLLL